MKSITLMHRRLAHDSVHSHVFAPLQRLLSITIRATRPPAFHPVLLAWAVSTCFYSAVSHAATLPTEGTVVSGVATIENDGASRMRIAQTSERAVVQWEAFDIGAQARVDILQPSREALLVNRVMGDEASCIAGAMRANGSVVLINRNGIDLKSSAALEASNLLLSALDTTDQEIDTLAREWHEWHDANASAEQADPKGDGVRTDMARGNRQANAGAAAWLAARHTVFSQLSAQSSERRDRKGGGIINHGRMRVKDGGHIGLLGTHVTHTGAIIADGGRIAIAGFGDKPDQHRNHTRDGPSSMSPMVLAGETVTVSGLLRANTITPGVNAREVQSKQHGVGQIAIDGREGSVTIKGTLVASVEHDDTRGAGGDIAIAGRQVRLHQALIDVAGATAGGRISLSTQGAYPGLQRIDVDQGSSLLAQGSGAGNGGDIHVASVGQTVFDGTAVVSGDRSGLREIYASGARADSGVFGRLSSVTPMGEGGNIVLAGLSSLVVGGEIDASSAKGARKGSIRFDASEVLVGSRHTRSRLAGAVMPRMGVIDAGTVSSALTGADVTIVARGQNELGKLGSIYVGGPVIWHSDSALTMQAAGDVSVHGAIHATGKYALFKREAARPMLRADDTSAHVVMTGAHASPRSAQPIAAPSLSANALSNMPAQSTSKYSVAAPARIERGRLIPPPLRLPLAASMTNGQRGQISQVGLAPRMVVRQDVNRLVTEDVRPANHPQHATMGKRDAAGEYDAQVAQVMQVGRVGQRLGGPVLPNAVSSDAAKADEQRTRAEALAFRADSPAESLVRSLVHVRVHVDMTPLGEEEDSDVPL